MTTATHLAGTDRQAAAPGVAVAAAPAVRPRWRGLIHRWAAPVSAVLFVALAVATPGGGSRAVVAVYGVCVTAMLTVSAVYHSGRLSPAAMRRMKRVDHSMILVAIAGTYTAVTSLALDGPARTFMLCAVWTAAAVGVFVRLRWLDAPYPVAAAVYLVVGWLVLIDIGAYLRALSPLELALLAFGGVLYTVGGVVYALHKPNPWPNAFGYHEVFHALVAAGALCHYLTVVALV